MTRAAQMLIDGTFETFPDSVATFDPSEMGEMMQEMKRQDGLLNFSQAATLLGLSRARVSQLVMDGTFQRFTFCGHHYVSMKEVRVRAATEIKLGRPPKNPVKQVRNSVKAALQTDKVQAKQGGYAGHKSRKK